MEAREVLSNKAAHDKAIAVLRILWIVSRWRTDSRLNGVDQVCDGRTCGGMKPEMDSTGTKHGRGLSQDT